MAESAIPLIQYRGVDLRHDDYLVVEEIDFDLYPSDFVFLTGRSGSGKSSFLKSMYGEMGIDKASEAKVLEYDMTKIKMSKLPKLRRRLGIVFQDFQLLTDRSVTENLKFVLRATGWKNKREIDRRIKEVLEMVNLKTKGFKLPNQLSGGEQQRVVIARAILNNPEIILADEPTGNLDEKSSQDVMELLQSIAQSGTAVIMSTHDELIVKKHPGKVIRCEEKRFMDITASYRGMTETIKEVEETETIEQVDSQKTEPEAVENIPTEPVADDNLVNTDDASAKDSAIQTHENLTGRIDEMFDELLPSAESEETNQKTETGVSEE